MRTDKEKNFVSAVIYFRNNGSVVENCLNTVYSSLNENFINFEIICVDDNSGDNTADNIKAFSKRVENGSVTLIKTSKYQGTEAAMSAGVNIAIGDYVFEFDTPYLDFEKSLIFELYQKSLEGFDVVSASSDSYSKGTSNLFYKIFNKFSSIQNTIQSESFRVISRRAINKVYSMGKFVKYRKALYANCSLPVTNIKYKSCDKNINKSKGKDTFRKQTAMTSLILFTDFAYRVSIVFSFLMMLATVFIGIYAIVMFFTKTVVEGFTTTMLVMSGSFFAVFIILAIIIKYLSVIVELVFNEQEYMIESVEKLS